MITNRWLMVSLLCVTLGGCNASDDTGEDSDAPIDADNDGFSVEDDCDDAAATINPDADELCDELDNDCDGLIDDEDDDVTSPEIWYADTDGDGFGVDDEPVMSCVAPTGYVADAGDCAPDDDTISPGEAEICDEIDNNCSGTVDDAEALGSTMACAAVDCVALRDAGDESGVRWIDPSGSRAFEVWCEQDAGSGGWAALWTITGGAIGTDYSLTDLFSGAAPDEVIGPHWQTLASGINASAGADYVGSTDMSYMKVSELFESDGTSIRYTELVAHLNGNTLLGLFDRPRPAGTARCDTLPDVIEFELADGSVQFGQTDQLWLYWNGSTTPSGSIAGFGVATLNEADPSRSCNVTSENQVLDPNNDLMHPEGNPNESFSYWLGYNVDAQDGNATRCLHHCWTSDWNGGRYNAVTWFARPSR
ncbi:MAG: putative metal-binding motif-containing protein [Myxococcota bacterium]